MEKSHLATRVREYRTRKGMSQEVLAEKSGISHRTVQRIENGESNPTGDTLQRLSTALGINPDELMDWTIKEDRGYLVFLNLSALSFIIFPILGILVPFIMWTSQKDKIMDVNKVGGALINFQVNWLILLVFIPVSLFLVSKIELLESVSFRTLFIIVAAMYMMNIIFIIINTIRLNNNRGAIYYSLIKFLR